MPEDLKLTGEIKTLIRKYAEKHPNPTVSNTINHLRSVYTEKHGKQTGNPATLNQDEESQLSALVARELEELDLIEAVTDYTYHRHSDLTASNVVGFDQDDLERIQTERGYLVFTVEDVHITENLKEWSSRPA